MRRLAVAVLLMLACAATPVLADPIAEFYKGKQIRFIIRSGVGGTYDLYGRLLSKHMPRHIPGNPTMLPVNMGGGGGIRMHHKFVVIDFDQPTGRVYLGSYNFSNPADTQNGENLLLIRDRRIAVSYMVEALRIFDHYHFRLAQADAKRARKKLLLQKPPRKAGEQPWWQEDYTDPRKIRDGELFA